MSLEQALADNTAAIRKLIAAMRPAASVAAPKSVTTYHVESTKDDVSTIVARVDGLPVLVKPDEKAAPEVPYVLPALQPREAEPEVAVIEYAQISKAITTAFVKDRSAVVAALAKFGATKGPELKVSDYAAFLVELA